MTIPFEDRRSNADPVVLVPCPVCSARRGYACTEDGIPKRWRHYERRMTAKLVDEVMKELLDAD